MGSDVPSAGGSRHPGKRPLETEDSFTGRGKLAQICDDAEEEEDDEDFARVRAAAQASADRVASLLQRRRAVPSPLAAGAGTPVPTSSSTSQGDQKVPEHQGSSILGPLGAPLLRRPLGGLMLSTSVDGTLKLSGSILGGDVRAESTQADAWGNSIGGGVEPGGRAGCTANYESLVGGAALWSGTVSWGSCPEPGPCFGEGGSNVSVKVVGEVSVGCGGGELPPNAFSACSGGLVTSFPTDSFGPGASLGALPFGGIESTLTNLAKARGTGGLLLPPAPALSGQLSCHGLQGTLSGSPGLLAIPGMPASVNRNIPVGIMRKVVANRVAEENGGCPVAGNSGLNALVIGCGDEALSAVLGVGLAPNRLISGIVPAPLGSNPDGGMLFSLAQVAEESARYVMSAAAFCAQPSDLSQVPAVANAAEEAASRVTWAAGIVHSYELTGAAATKGTKEQDKKWVDAVKQAVVQCSEASDAGILGCRAAHQLYREIESANPSCKDADRRSKVPCKFFEQGICFKGDTCALSHDPKDKTPKPLSHKRAEECKFFPQGKCTRGAGCTFAHGQLELETIAAVREEHERMKKVRGEGLAAIARPGDWHCPGCKDLQFARNFVCRRCGRAKPADA